MIAYHGSKNTINPFQPNLTLHASSEGSFGTGIYFADLKAANEYAGGGEGHTVLCFDIDVTGFLSVQADFEMGEKYDLDTAALPLIMVLFGLTENQAANWFLEHTTDGFLLGDDIQKQAEIRGYKGLHLNYGNCFELVCYDFGSALVLGPDSNGHA